MNKLSRSAWPILPLVITTVIGGQEDPSICHHLCRRCFVGWDWTAKAIYLSWNLLIAVYGLVLALIIALNLTRPQTRKRNIVAALR